MTPGYRGDSPPDQHKKEKETYTMTYVCGNCGYRFDVKVPKGETASRLGQAGLCPYCGVQDSQFSDPARRHKPILQAHRTKPSNG